MTHKIEPIEHWIGGDTIHLPFAVPDEDTETPDDRKDLSGSDISWALLHWDDESVVLSTDDDGVALSMSNPSSGEFEIVIDADTGDSLEGPYKEWMQIYSAAGDRQTWTGTFTVTENKLSNL